jgi:hypothetical protein
VLGLAEMPDYRAAIRSSEVQVFRGSDHAHDGLPRLQVLRDCKCARA